MAEPRRGPFRSGVRLDPSQVSDMRGRSALRIGGRRLRKRGTTAGGVQMAVPRPVVVKTTKTASPVRRGIRNDHTPEGRARIQKVKGVRLRETFSRPSKGMGSGFTRKPVIRGGMPVPAGALGAAISIGRTVLGGLRGSPTTGPTKIARISQAAAGPISGVRTNKPKPISSRPRRGGNARLA